MIFKRAATILQNHSLVSIFALIASKLVFLATTLVFTNFMSVEDFGIISVFMSYVALLLPLITFNIYSGFGRLLYDENFSLSHQIFNTLLFGFAALALFALIIFSINDIETLIFLPYGTKFFLVIVIGGLFFEFLITQYFIYTKDSVNLLRVIFLKSIIVIFISIILLSQFSNNHYLALIYAEVAGSIFLCAYFIKKHSPLKFSLDISYLKTSLSYAVPLIVYSFAMSALSQSDRIIILKLDSELSAGLYSMAYNIGSLILILSTGLLNANNPRFYKLTDSKLYRDILDDSLKLINYIFLAVFILILFAPFLSNILLPDNYYESFRLIGLVGIICFTHLFFQIWVRVLSYEKRSILIASISLVACILNIYLNIITIPIFGYEAAIYTTFASYFLMNLVIIFFLNLKNFILYRAIKNHLFKLSILIIVYLCMNLISNYVFFKFIFILSCLIILIKFYKGIIPLKV